MTNQPPTEPAEWMPKTREDWVGLFSDGAIEADNKREALKAEKEALNPPPPTDDVPPKKLSLAERMMGIKP